MEKSLLKSYGIFCCITGVLVTFTMISWIISVFPEEALLNGNEESRSKRAIHSVGNKMCTQILPPEFYEPFTHTRNTNCNPMLPSEYDCNIMNKLFSSQETIRQIDSCKKVLSGISFKMVSCTEEMNPRTCWKRAHIPNTKTRNHIQCRIFYQTNGTDEIKTLSFLTSNAGMIFHKLQIKYKLDYFMLLCNLTRNRNKGNGPSAPSVHYRLISYDRPGRAGNSFHRNQKSHQNGNNKGHIDMVNIVVIPSISRAGFYSMFEDSTEAMRDIKSSPSKQVFDFAMYQSRDLGSLSKYITVMLEELVSLKSNPIDKTKINSDFHLNPYFDNSCKERKSNELTNKFPAFKMPLYVNYDRRNELSAFLCRLYNNESFLKPLYSSNPDCPLNWMSNALLSEMQLTLTRYFMETYQFQDSEKAQQHLTPDKVSIDVNILRADSTGNSYPSYTAIDLALANHITNSGKLGNSVTLIVSERGLIHKHYAELSSYGQMERDNPIFFLLLPKTLEKNQRYRRMLDNLQTLQTGLVSIRDVSGILWSVIESSEIRGKYDHKVRNTIQRNLPVNFHDTGQVHGQFHNLIQTSRNQSHINLATEAPRPALASQLTLNTNQTCSSLGIRQPTLCLCQNEYIQFSNDTMQVAVAEFALGEMNGLLRRSLHSSYAIQDSEWPETFTHSPYGPCGKIYGTHFNNVRIAYNNGSIVTKMSINVTTNSLSGISQDYRNSISTLYFVTVQRIFENGGSKLKLLNFERASFDHPESSNLNCAAEISSLCLCDTSIQKYTFSKRDMLHELSHSQFGIAPVLINIHGACLFLVVQHYRHSAAYESANVCEDHVYDFTLHLHGRNMVFSGNYTVHVTLGPVQETFMAVAMQSSYYKQASQVWYTTTVRWRPV